jgi:hypothetical protein
LSCFVLLLEEMRLSSVLVTLVVTVALLSAVEAKRANVVYYAPKLDVALSDVIHPYAWSEQRPTPYYEPHMNAYNIGDEKHLNPFLEVQTHMTKDSPAAASLVEVAVVRRKGFFKKIGRGLMRGARALGRGIGRVAGFAGRMIKRVGVGGLAAGAAGAVGGALLAKGIGGMMGGNTFSAMGGFKPENNPASDALFPLKPMASDFRANPPASDRTGSFPGSQAFRRAVYGVRRRRMPYFSHHEGFGSANPYRRANDFFKAPNDFLSPRTKFFHNSAKLFDYGRFAEQETKLPYAGFSSFAHHRSTGEPAIPGRPRSGGVFSHTPFSHAHVDATDNGMRFLSNGMPIPPQHFKESDFGEPTIHPHFGALPGPFVGNDHKFRDFYGGGAAHGESTGSA